MSPECGAFHPTGWYPTHKISNNGESQFIVSLLPGYPIVTALNTVATVMDETSDAMNHMKLFPLNYYSQVQKK